MAVRRIDRLPASRPLWCLVSSRGRLADTPAASLAALVALVAAAAEAGVQLIQIREGDLEAGEQCALVQACVAAVEGSGSRVLVNERTDVALAAGAGGVHLRADAPPASRIRSLVPPTFLIGRSVHSVAEARAAVADGGVDYLTAGTVFETASKPGRRDRLGLEGLRRIVEAADVPVLAIGGIDASTAELAGRTGVAGAAAIGVFCRGGRTARELAATVDRLRGAFDSSGHLP